MGRAMSARPRIALLGAGVMGANHARVLAASSRAELGLVIDRDAGRARAIADLAGARASSDLEDAAGFEAAILASPTETHVELGLAMLALGLPVLVEKPLAVKPDDARRLVEESAARDIPLTCGFVERFNPVVTAASEALSDAPVHLVAIRHSPRAPRIATSVVFDLLIHDIDLALRLASEPQVAEVRSSVWVSPQSGVPEIADCLIRFSDGALATLSASRVGQRKIRTLAVTTATTLAEIDLLRADLTLYRNVSQEQLTERGMGYRAETIVDIPFVRHAGEPLAQQLDHFLDLVDGTADADAERATLLAPHEIAAEVEAG